MKPRISVITLGVDSLERALAFYRDGLGWPTEGIVGREFEHGAVVFFALQPALKLALFARASLAHDAGVAVGAASAGECVLSHNVATRADVGHVMAAAAAAGARSSSLVPRPGPSPAGALGVPGVDRFRLPSLMRPYLDIVRRQLIQRDAAP